MHGMPLHWLDLIIHCAVLKIFNFICLLGKTGRKLEGEEMFILGARFEDSDSVL